MNRVSIQRPFPLLVPATTQKAARVRKTTLPFTPLIIIILILAALVRIIGLARLDLGTDEAHSFLTVTSPRGILVELQNDTNPPLYFFILKAWTTLFGTSLPAMRLLSALFGIAAVGALAGFVRQCGAPRQTIAWTLLLAAFTPIQLHYAQLARGYTFCGLLLTLGLWSFVYAIQSRRPSAWLLHGIIIALSVWSHAIFVPVTAGYLLAAWFMRVPKRTFINMSITLALALTLSLPGLFLVLHQAQTSGGVNWLRDYWLATPPALAIPKSLALLALGGNMPRYLLALPRSRPMQLLALGLTALAVGAFFWPRKVDSNPPVETQNPGIEPAQLRRLLMVFTFWPLVFIWCYSELSTPIYLVGRYDLFAQPAYLVLVALGLTRLQNTCAQRHTGWLLPVAVCAVLAAGVSSRWMLPLDPQIFHHQARVDYLAGQFKPGDAIICTGLEASPTLYWLHQRGINSPVLTLPRDTLDHIGWLADDQQIAAHHDQWPVEILAALHTAAPGARGRVWIFFDPAIWNPPGDFAPTPRQALSQAIVPTALANGWRLAETDPTHQTAETNLRIVSLVREPK